MSQYNNIAIFKNTKAGDNPKAPSHNVQIEFSDGTKWKGGLWPRTSKAGLQYLSGNLEADDGSGATKQVRVAKPEEELVDW
tara:strand:- start:4797 stop:5039 length:243 start_codon:yes stop_codon:yes gene_type:complete